MPASSILNVDDYAPGLYARTKILRQAGFDVIEATSGEQALDLAAEHKPALVLLDVNLPDMHGFEVCRRIRASPALAATSILHISASSVHGQQQVHGLESGADGYMVEPVEPAVLVATIKAYLRVREVESALRRSNEELERFAYRVTHDLKQPLRTISLYQQRLGNHLAGKLDPRAVELMQYIQDGVLRMGAFIDGLLKYSQSNHAGSEVRLLNIETLLAGAIGSLEGAIQESGAKITHDALPRLVTDPRIEDVLQNLIGNAIKYRRQDVAPEVHVSAKQEDGNWVFSVRDNGVGIHPDYQRDIFEVFHRLHGQDIPGAGIGLALAQRIVETNGGKLWVESKVGSGSTFYFTILQSKPAAPNTSPS
ncbi:MAG: ATP-binding protein [Bryobacteraceae bacterium]|jgi:signal transduction histidine kinase